MITILLVTANVVLANFIDLSSLLPNATWEVAEGWEVEEVARIKLEDLAYPMHLSSAGNSTYSCLVNLSPRSVPVWECIVGGRNTITTLNSDGDFEMYPVELDRYLIIPEYNDSLIGITAQYSVNEPVYKNRAYLLNTDSGTMRVVIDHRDEIAQNGQGDHFWSLLGASGVLFFTDYQGIVGVRSTQFTDTETQVTESSDWINIMDQCVSGNGQLYFSAIQGGGTQGLVAGVTPEGVSWVNSIDLPRWVDISYSGDIVVTNETFGGIYVFDGVTGELLQRFITDSQIASLNISPGGNYVTALVANTSSRPYEARPRSLVLIDRIEQVETHIDPLAQHGYSSHLITHHVTDQGDLLLEDVQVPSDGTKRLYLVTREGSWIWKSEDISGLNRINNSTIPISRTITAIEETSEGYLIAYYNNNLNDMIIIRLEKKSESE